MGYSRAGFDVTGVDIAPQPNFPFEFKQADALTFPLDGFDLIHASPPCQAHTTMSNRWRGAGGKADTHVDLIAMTRRRLLKAGTPYVIENVPGARKFLISPFVLTGEMFGLRVHRPRLFESSLPLTPPEKPSASKRSIGVYGKAHDGRLLWRRKDGSEQRAAGSLKEARAAMGMPWASWRGCAEAIPPAYTEWVGGALLAEVLAAR